jgi:hypothetical protein
MEEIIAYIILSLLIILNMTIICITSYYSHPKSKCEGLTGEEYLICNVKEKHDRYIKHPTTYEESNEHATTGRGWTTRSEYDDAHKELANFRFNKKMAKEKLIKDEQKKIKKEEAEKFRLAKSVSEGTRSKTKIKGRIM